MKIFILIISMSHNYRGSAIDHMEFKSKQECVNAGQLFVKENDAFDSTRFVCVEKTV